MLIDRTARLLGGLVLLAGILLALSAPVRAQTVSFSGTWETIANGTHKYTVVLEQTGKAVTGSYSPGKGKIFDGVVTDNKLTFKWTQDGGYEGTGEFTMNEDGKGFKGSSTALKPQEFTNPWNTYEPETASFAGDWETLPYGQDSALLTMVQTGNKVTGIYPSSKGKIEGTVSGKVLSFRWESDSGSGSGSFVMEESAQAFSGTYKRDDNPNEENSWNGNRSSGKGGKITGSGTNSAASFAGEWEGAFGELTLTWKLKQTGDQVTGQVLAEGGTSAVIKEGIVTGKTLRLKLEPADGAVVLERPPGNVELVMDEGGKSFKGKMDGAAVTGSFVGPNKP